MSENPTNSMQNEPDIEEIAVVRRIEPPSRQGDTAENPVVVEGDIDVVGAGPTFDEQDVVMPAITSSGEVLRSAAETTPTKSNGSEYGDSEPEKVFSSFPCQIIPETLGRMTRTPPDGEHLEVYKNQNGRLRIYVVDHFKKFSPYSNSTHKPCTVCNRAMKSGEMHLNFPADLDRRRIWANLLGFKYKDILRSKMGPVSFSIAAGPICTEHFAEECFRNHNFNKSAIEAFGVPVAISPDVKTTPSKKSSRVPWVCTICDFHSCSVVELQTHLLDHTEEMLKKKDSVLDVPEAGFMCPFCRKCTYGYKTITGYRRHLNAGPIHHCHLRRIYEFAKMNCRATELDPVDSWDNWTRRNVYVAYHGCEPPANEIVLTPSPTKKAYIQNPEERTRLVHDEERRRKAVRSLSFVGKEGGTSVNDHNVMQRAVVLQLRREAEYKKKCPDGSEEREKEEQEEEEETGKEPAEKIQEEPETSTQSPMGSTERRKSRRQAASATSSPVKKPIRSTVSTATAPSSPSKNKRKLTSEEPVESAPPAKAAPPAEPPQISPNDPRERLRQKIRDEQFAQMVQKRSQQVKRLIHAKKLRNEPMKPRKALSCNLAVGLTSNSSVTSTSSTEPEEIATAPKEPTPQPSSNLSKRTRSSRKKKETTPVAKEEKPVAAEEPPKEPVLKSMLARSFAAGVRPSMAKYHVPLESFSSSSSSPIPSSSAGIIGGRSVSSGAIAASRAPTTSPGGGLFARVRGAAAQNDQGLAKRPSVLARRPIILSPRKRASTPRQTMSHHESSPNFSGGAPNLSDEYLISATDLEVGMVEEVIESMSSSDEPTGSSQPVLTLAEALELDSGAGGKMGTVREHELEAISNEMMKDSSSVFRVMEDVIKGRTVTKMRADMRLSRHCIRQIEAARARARLFGEGTEDYHIYYSNDGAQVLTRADPKWKELQQQQQYPQQPGASDQQ